MKLILTEDVRGTGKKGDTVSVKDGYGRNFLIPRGFAIPASEGNVTRLDSIVRGLDNKRKRDMKNAEDQRAQLEELSLVLKMRAGSDGRLFGSVTHKDIAEAIKNACSLEIDKKAIRIDEPIKMTGSHTVSIHLTQDVNASVKIEVEKQEE
ncbi:MAG TPA: 50S ribosomal protein L9 [Syntrophorhabdaceae bacterium]|nr:50S ribosomal protein L9 [Syntrophorhabdaceae bacterium]